MQQQNGNRVGLRTAYEGNAVLRLRSHICRSSPRGHHIPGHPRSANEDLQVKNECDPNSAHGESSSLPGPLLGNGDGQGMLAGKLNKRLQVRHEACKGGMQRRHRHG
eukprot:gene17615-biopygen7257